MNTYRRRLGLSASTLRRAVAAFAGLALLLGALLPGVLRSAAPVRGDGVQLADLCIVKSNRAAPVVKGAKLSESAGGHTDTDRPCCDFCLPIGGLAGLEPAANAVFVTALIGPLASHLAPADVIAVDHARRPPPRAPPLS